MELSDRINTAIEMVTACGVVADVGCDHCLSLISLIKSGVCEKGIGIDINKGPLDRARKNIEAHRLSDKIELRLGNGLEAVSYGEADAIIIAGIGGITISGIISRLPDTAKSASQLILQPHSDVYAVRKCLHMYGLMIKEEKMIKEKDKFYVTIKAGAGLERYDDEAGYLFGKLLIKGKCNVLQHYLEVQLQKNTYIIESLQNKNTDSCKLRIAEIDRVNKMINELLRSC